MVEVDGKPRNFEVTLLEGNGISLKAGGGTGRISEEAS